jgi:hypothetical protein
MVVVKNKTVYTYGDGDGIIIVVAIYHLLYGYRDCSVKLTEEYKNLFYNCREPAFYQQPVHLWKSIW